MNLRYAVAPIALFAIACSGPLPYTTAAGVFANTAADGAHTLGKVEGTLSAACKRRSEFEYFVVQFERAKLERNGLPITEISKLKWSEWLDYAPVVAGKKGPSRRERCKAIADSAHGFALAVGALEGYASALGAFASSGNNIGASIGDIGDDVGKVTGALTGDDDAATAIRLAGKATQELGDALFAERKDEDIHQFVARAAPHVRAISDGLLKYLKAVDEEVNASLVAQTEMLRSVEALTGLANIQPPPPKTTPASAPKCPDKPAKKLDAEALHDEVVCLQGMLQQRDAEIAALRRDVANGPADLDGVRLVTFFDLARRTDDEEARVRGVVAGYAKVVGGIQKAHDALAKAGDDPDKTDFKSMVKEIITLAHELGELKNAIDGKKED